MISCWNNEGSFITLSYDEFSNIRELTDNEGQIVTCSYDGLSRLVRAVVSSDRVTEYWLNANGLTGLLRQTEGTERRVEYTRRMTLTFLLSGSAVDSRTVHASDAELHI